MQFAAVVAVTGAESVSLMQQAWLMRAIVIELRVTSLNRQRSHTERLMALLLDDSYHLQSTTGNLPPFFCHFLDGDILFLSVSCGTVWAPLRFLTRDSKSRTKSGCRLFC